MNNRLKGNGKWARVWSALCAVLLMLPVVVLAESMNSLNYAIPFDDLSGGGERSVSGTYRLEDTIAEQSTPTGEDLASLNYRACAGFQCLLSGRSLTAVIATSSSACTSTTTGGTYTIALGTLTTSSVTTGSTHVCVRATMAGGSAVAAQVSDLNGGLKSTSVPGDTITSGSATLTAGVAGHGVCVTNASGGFTAASPYNGSCDTSTNHAVGIVTTSPQTFCSSSGPVTDAYCDILTKASISTTTPAHTDYADTMTFIVTATY